jgi:hypothetical protein
MLYVLDDDQFNLISKESIYAFILNSGQSIRYYRNEDQIDFKIDELSIGDFVCYHNSFPCDKTLLTNRLVEANESTNTFTLVCFSAASEFLNLLVEDKFIKIHKDRFYNNLKTFVGSGFILDNLLYGEYSKDVELSLIQNRLKLALFSYSSSSALPINELQPRDLKRICELTGFDYKDLLDKINDFSVDKFKRFINVLIQNK